MKQRARTASQTAAWLASLLFLLLVTSAGAQTFTVLHNFTNGRDGGNPIAGLVLDRAGNLYGTASTGGNAGFGSVYELKHAGEGWILTTLYNFAGGTDGQYPLARVVFGPDGTLYGTTEFGGINNCYPGCGIVFNLRPPATACHSALCGWNESVLYRFTGGQDGANPEFAEVTFDGGGNIYSTASQSIYGFGVVYELSRGSGGWTQTVLHTFDDFPKGILPSHGVIFDATGNLYGTTYYGGTSGGYGVAFQLTHSGSDWTESVLHSFSGGADGGEVYAGLVLDATGNLYGATSSGGSNGSGTVFQLSSSSGCWSMDVLADFLGSGNTVGANASLTMDRSGNLYGTTVSAGQLGFGNVFKLSPSQGGWTYTSLHDFTGGDDGGAPYGSVVLDANGNLYGTASQGGTDNHGVVWEITP